jgi:hypothetical protein
VLTVHRTSDKLIRSLRVSRFLYQLPQNLFMIPRTWSIYYFLFCVDLRVYGWRATASESSLPARLPHLTRPRVFQCWPRTDTLLRNIQISRIKSVHFVKCPQSLPCSTGYKNPSPTCYSVATQKAKQSAMAAPLSITTLDLSGKWIMVRAAHFFPPTNSVSHPDNHI